MSTTSPTSSPIEPTVGRIVLFRSVDHGDMGNSQGEEVPAIVTRVHSKDCLNLQVFRDNASVMAKPSVAYDARGNESSASNSWRWMEHQLAVGGKPSS